MRVKILQQTHPDYDHEHLERLRALYEGGEEWQECVQYWLPQHPQETDETYERRLKRATYENHVGPICELLAAGVFAEAPTPNGFDGDWESRFLANCDAAGSTLAQWASERLVDALVERTVYAWVNLPRRPDDVVVESLADQERAGLLDAYLVTLRACQVIDWREDAQGRLVWLIARDVVEERATVEGERTEVWRWTYIDAQQIRRWTWTPRPGMDEPGENEEATEEPAIAHGFGRLPVVRLQLPRGLHAMGKLHDPAVNHLRGRNDLSWALHVAAHALLVIRAAYDDDKPVLGPGRYLRLSQPTDEASYVEPSGANFEILANDVKDRREELYRVVQQMAVGQGGRESSKAAQSGESKTLDWRSLEVVLSKLAEQTKSWLAEVLQLVQAARGKRDAQITVSGLDGWQEEELDVWLKAAAMAMDAHSMSDTFKRTVARKQAERLLQREDPKVLDAIRKEIESADLTDPLKDAYAPAKAAK